MFETAGGGGGIGGGVSKGSANAAAGASAGAGGLSGGYGGGPGFGGPGKYRDDKSNEELIDASSGSNNLVIEF